MMKYNVMEIERFLEDLKRMCHSSKDCVGCPFDGISHNSCSKFIINNPQEAIKLTEQWNDKHPKKTFLMDFLEKFPNAKLTDDGIPYTCAKNLYNTECKLGCVRCSDCWKQEMELK